MTTTLKIILIIVTWFIGAGIANLINTTADNPNAFKGFGYIIAIGLVAASRAIWKYEPQKNDESTDIDKLDKS